MKSPVLLSLLLIPFFALSQIGVNTTTPNAMLDVSSTNQGMLVPRIALTSAIDAATVINPQGGALQTSTLIYNTATAGTSPNAVSPGFYYWNGTRWISLGAVPDWQLTGNTATNDPAAPVTYGTSTIAAGENFIGTTDGQDLVIATDNIERMRIKNGTGFIGVGTANPFYKLHVRSDDPAITLNSESFSSGGMGVRGWAANTAGSGTGGSFTGGDTGITARAEAGSFAGSSVGINASAVGTAGTRVGGYFFASGGTNNYAILTPQTGGFVGIGTQTPTHRLEVSEFTAGVPALLAVNSSTTTVDGTGIRGFSVNNPGYGIGGSFEGGYRGITAEGAGSSYTGTVYGIQGNATGTAGTRVGGYFTASGGTTNLAVHANGRVRISDGTQAAGRVLTSDAAGNASWQQSAIQNIVGVLGLGVNIPYTQTSSYLQTGSYIDLPPGRYVVNVSMLLSKYSLTYSPNNSFFWVRSSFSLSAGVNPLPTTDIVGSNLCSGNFPGSSVYALLSGMVIINNASAVTRRYYYIAGSVVANNTTETLGAFGGAYWAENNIIAYRLN